MNYCDLTLPTPEENLACDEALLDFCETGGRDEVLRVWEPTQYFVVVGYANRAATEVNLSFCRQRGIAVRRRCTGGGTVLQGPGCLNYSLVLRIDEAGPLRSIASSNDFIMERNQQALGALLGARVEKQGHTDLAIEGLKFSGNAQRRRKRFLLFHGSLLLNLDLALVEKALPLPSKQPDYRGNRSHKDFLMNLNVPAQAVKAALAGAWGASGELPHLPLDQIARLSREKYARDEWNLKF
ncbi:MAG TPA: lipoate--protein ligase family protein [Candidatus Binatia bacterium]|jgi:lipoate-protein ligase A|nr:lipoate--protein ligase family protein [Candidatus Binatia bacterium]